MLRYTANIPVGIDVDVSANLQKPRNWAKPILSQIPEIVGLSPTLEYSYYIFQQWF